MQKKYGDKGPIDWSLQGPPIGIDANDALEKQPAIPKSSEKKRASLAAAEITFDEEEEEAMLNAVIQAEENIHCSQSNDDNEDLFSKEINKAGNTKADA